jgi:hypothetical protein
VPARSAARHRFRRPCPAFVAGLCDAAKRTGGGLLDWEIVLLLGAVLAPLAAAVTAVWPSRATRWAARACLTMVALAVLLLPALRVEDNQANRGYDDADSGEYVDQGDDSGVVIAMSAVVIAIGLANLAGWAVANARTRTHRARLPPPPTAASGR